MVMMALAWPTGRQVEAAMVAGESDEVNTAETMSVPIDSGLKLGLTATPPVPIGTGLPTGVPFTENCTEPTEAEPSELVTRAVKVSGSS